MTPPGLPRGVPLSDSLDGTASAFSTCYYEAFQGVLQGLIWDDLTPPSRGKWDK